MGRNNKPLIIGAAVFGLLALLLTGLLLTRSPGGPTPPPPPPPGTEQPAQTAQKETSTRLVAARNIPPRSAVTEDMVTTAPVETETVPGAPAPASFADYSDVQKLVSQGQLTGRLIRAGEPLSADMFVKPLGRVVPANIQVPRGFRAVAIWVNPDQTAAGLVDAGDRIDVVSTHQLALEKPELEGYQSYLTGAKNGAQSRTLAQNLLVLGVDKSIALSAIAPTPTPVPAAPGVPGAAPPPPPPPPPPAAAPQQAIRVLVAASPLVAQRLIAANELGKLHVLIRDPNDTLIAPVPESREYPGRYISVRKSTSGGGGGTGGGRSRTQNVQDFGGFSGGNNMAPPVPNPIQGVTSPTIPVGPMPTEGMAAPSGTADVTVIRGTNKEKITVPAR